MTNNIQLPARTNWLNNWALGIACGLIGPAIALLVFWLWRFNGSTWQSYVGLLRYVGAFTQVVAIGAALNLTFFYYFLNRQAWNTVRGILLSTLVLALWMVYERVLA